MWQNVIARPGSTDGSAAALELTEQLLDEEANFSVQTNSQGASAVLHELLSSVRDAEMQQVELVLTYC